jgi:simple sugar transport system ATP-binding protein
MVTDMDIAVSLHGVVKIYPETNLHANDQVDLTLYKGEILCLAGENGAGKTTLMKVLYGMERPDAGTISIGGIERTITSVMDANALGIGMVQQHVMLIDDFTVAQNVVLGLEPKRFGMHLDIPRSHQLVNEVIKAHQFSIDAADKVASLTVGQKQQVEIIKMLYRDVDMLILDEPTAVLTEQETEALFHTLRVLAQQGKSIILITHKLHEIRAISDRVAIMRQGTMIGEFETATISEQEISRMMMGQSVSLDVVKRPYHQKKRPVITFTDVSVVKRNQPRPLLNHLSFTAYTGEVLGFAGVSGNGLGVLEAVLGGFLPVSTGSVTHDGKDVTLRDTRRARSDGLAYVPADRLKVGSALYATVAENMMVASREQFTRFGFLRKKKIMQHADHAISMYNIRAQASSPIGTLSGGNIQKVVLAREIERLQDFIVFSEPTWGLDVASSRFVYDKIMSLRDLGTAVILISSNLDEILALSDRVAILCQGSISALLTAKEVSQVSKEEMGSYMLGVKRREVFDV